MTKRTVVHVLAVLFAFAAANISFNLLVKHLGGTPGPGWFQAGCNENEAGGGANCAAVLASRYASFPFKKDTDPPDTVYIPVALFGLVYYSALVVWLIGIGRPSYARRWVHGAPLAFVAVGLISSVFFTYVMFTELNEWCPWCLVTHILNLLIAVSLLLMWPRLRPGGWPVSSEMGALIRPDESAAPAPQTHATPAEEPARASLTDAAEAPAETPPPPAATGIGLPDQTAHPSFRLMAAVLAAMLFLAFGQWQMSGKAQLYRQATKAKRSFVACMAAVKRIQGDTGTLMVQWQKEEPLKITIRPDDPRRPPDNAERPAMKLVVFSDLECHACRKLAEFLDHEARPLFDGSLDIVFKHYPLHSDCNPRTTTRMHRHACEAARMAEAARIVGGNEAFWNVHDFLFENQQRLEKDMITPEVVAQSLGLDRQEFLGAMASPEIRQRLWEDIDLAKRCGVTGTPTLFINGKRLDNLATTAMGFWSLLADLYWEGVGIERPASTRPPDRKTTPDTPDPSAAP